MYDESDGSENSSWSEQEQQSTAPKRIKVSHRNNERCEPKTSIAETSVNNNSPLLTFSSMELELKNLRKKCIFIT